MKRELGGLAAAICALAGAAAPAGAAEGDLDPAFSGDGKLVYDVPGDGRAEGIVVDAQGRIVVVGSVDPAGGDPLDFAAARFLADGTPDSSFSGDGFASFNGSAADDEDVASDVVIDPATGAIYLGGASEADFAVMKLTTAGVPDPGYGGGDGLAELDTGNSDSLDGIRLDGAGRIVGGGTSNSNFAVARFTAAGVGDNTFGGGDGYETQNVNSAASTDSASGMEFDSQGRVLVSGFTRLSPGEENTAVMRFTAAGLLDTTFSNDIPTPGRLIEAMAAETPGATSDLAAGIDVIGDSPVVAGYADLGASGQDISVLKLTPLGAPDPGFGGGDGKAYVGLGSGERADGMTLDPQGRVVYAARTGSASEASLVAGRMTAAGVPDSTFGGDGNTVAELAPGTEIGSAATVDPSGRVLIAGYVGPFATAEWGIERFQAASVPGKCGGRTATVTGTPGNDKLKGTKKADVIAGGAGKDTISGLAGNDIVCGEAGKDRLLGGGGNDRLIGGAGQDVLKGGKGKDKLKGGAGKDKQVQ